MSEGEVVEAALRHLIAISTAVGNDRALAWGSGGNTSVKTSDGQYMYIKASGAPIKGVSETGGWRRLRVECVQRIAADPALAKHPAAPREGLVARRLLDCCDDGFGADDLPSIESLLHAGLGRCVVHLHATAVGPYVCSRQGRLALEGLFAANQPPPLWIPYADPGYALARSAARLIARYAKQHGQNPSLLFLQKHGLVVTADGPGAALRLVSRAIGRCQSGLPRPARIGVPEPPAGDIGVAQLAVGRALWEVAGERVATRRFMDHEIAAFLNRADARRLLAAPALTPEELVCAQGPPLWVERWEAGAIARALRRRTAGGNRSPRSFLGQGIGLIVAAPEQAIPAIGEVVESLLLVRQGTAALGGPLPLSRRQRESIAQM